MADLVNLSLHPSEERLVLGKFKESPRQPRRCRLMASDEHCDHVIAELLSACGLTTFRKRLVMFVFYLPAILEPEMAAPTLWAPKIFWFFLQETIHAHKR